jgi:hypothetical protein
MHLRTVLVLGSNRKIAIEKLKINYKAHKIKCGPIHKLQTIKNHELKLIRPPTQHKIFRTRVFKILNTTDTNYGENCETSSVYQEM